MEMAARRTRSRLSGSRDFAGLFALFGIRILLSPPARRVNPGTAWRAREARGLDRLTS
jgi:hypothetical protein